MHRNDRGVSTPLIAIGCALLLIAIIGGAWLLSVVLAEPIGRGEAVKQRESATNRIFAQETFRKQYEDYQSTLVKVDQAARARTTSPEAEVRFQGVQAYCAQVVADYNAAATSYRSQDFRDADLPERLDAASCTKETTP